MGLPLVALALPAFGVRVAGAPRRGVAVGRIHARRGSLRRLTACGALLARLAVTVVLGRTTATAMRLVAMGVRAAGLSVRMRLTLVGLAVVGLAVAGLAVPILAVARLPISDRTILGLITARLPRFAAGLVAVVPASTMTALAARFRVAMVAM